MLCLLFLISGSASSDLFECQHTLCSSSWIGDGVCDSVCMNPVCGYDSSFVSSDNLETFYFSDCYSECACSDTLLSNDVCDEDCNNYQCGWDLGKCGYCSSGCFESNLTNSQCDADCDVIHCLHDNDECGWCNKGCFISDLLGDTCTDECNGGFCYYYAPNPCSESLCSEDCFDSMIGEGTCHYKCYNSACGYDGGDCDCAKNCTFEDMNNDTACDYLVDEVNDTCATEECDYKNGLCGECAKGCFYDDIGNGVCDDYCNNEDCYYDYGDCQCSYNCKYKYSQADSAFISTGDDADACSIYCLVPQCYFGVGLCEDDDLIKEAVLGYAVSQDPDNILDLSECNCSDSDIEMYLDETSTTSCSSSDICADEKCFYCMGRATATFSGCLRNSFEKCLICTSTMVMDTCYKDQAKCPAGYFSSEKLIKLFGTSLWCLKDPVQYSSSNYHTIYVDSTLETDGNGGKDSPFNSFSEALLNIYATFTKVLLLNKNVVFQDNGSSSIYVSKVLDPLDTKSNSDFYELWIIGSFSETIKTKVYWMDNYKISPKASKVYIQNIEFIGTFTMKNDCITEFCAYCPYLNKKNNQYVNDRDEVIDYNTVDANYSTNCGDYSAVNVFTFTTKVYIENVTFVDFRYQYNSFIKSSSLLYLTNVNFSKMQASSAGSVILLSCSDNCIESDFIYSEGIVSDLGTGYDDTEFVETGSFIKANGFGYISIKNVEFSYNFNLINKQTAEYSYLLYSYNHIGTITISDCNFTANYVNYLIYIDVSTLAYSDYRLYFGMSEAYFQQHLLISNVVIKNTYCSEGMIYYLMKKVVHNIEIHDLVISDSVTGSIGMININNVGTLSDSEIYGESQKKLVGKEQVYIYFVPRRLNLYHINIKDSKTGGYAIFVVKYPNFYLNNISINNLGDGEVEDIKSIISLFNEDGNYRYLANIDETQEAPTLSCSGIITSTSTFNIYMTTLNIESTKCKELSGPSGLFLDQISGTTTLNTLSISNITSSSSTGIALSIANSKSITVSNLHLFNVTNSESSIINIEKCTNISFNSVKINKVYSYYEGPFIVYKVNKFYLRDFEIFDSLTESGNGGCLYMLVSALGSEFNIQSGTLTQCVSKIGKGGAFYIDSVSTNSICTLTVNNTKIGNCEATDGAGFYITGIVSFNLTAENEIKNLTVENCTCYQGGILSDFHYIGILVLRLLNMINNSGIYGGLSVFYVDSQSGLRIFDSVIRNSTSEDSILYFRGLDGRSLIELYNLNVYGVDSYCIKITKIQVSMNQVRLDSLEYAIKIETSAVLNAIKLKLTNANSGGISIDSSEFTCIDCIFRDNMDSLISVSGASSKLVLDGTQLENNNIASKYMIYLVSTTQENKIINSQIKKNFLTIGTLIYLLNSKLYISNSTIIENESSNSYAINIKTSGSVLAISNSTMQFSNLSLNDGTIINAEGGVIALQDSIFENSLGTSGIVYVNLVELTVSNCIFRNNTGGDISATQSLVTIRGSSFNMPTFSQSNTGAIKITSGITSSISNSEFTDAISTSFYDDVAFIYISAGEKLNIEKSSFIGSSYEVMGVFIDQCDPVTIKDSHFLNFVSNDYSALTAKSSRTLKTITLKNLKISNNYSQANGGGLYISDYNALIIDSEISFNKADDSGGGLFYSSNICSDCGLYIKGATTIFNNSCANDGGGIKWKNFKPSIEQEQLIFNNSGGYGSDLATVPARMGFLSGRKLSDSIIGIISDIPPGQKYTDSIQIYLFDTYGQVVSTENKMLCTLSVNDTIDDELTLSGTVNFQAQDGIFNLTNFILSGKPGSTNYLKVDAKEIGFGTIRNDDTEYQNSALFEVVFRECGNGEHIQSKACVVCAAGKYTIEASDSCISCPSGGTCNGGSSIVVDNGYWRSSLYSDVVYECLVFEACLKGNESNELGSCSSGYSGVLCQSCEIGYSKATDGKCSKCPSQAANITILLALSFCIVLVSVILVKTTLKSAFTPKALHSIYIKIFTNYLQLVFITTQFNMQWPSYVVELFNIQKSAATVSDQIFSVDCYLAQKSANDSSEGYYAKLCLIASMPCAIFIIAYSFWILKSFTDGNYKTLKREVYTTIIVLFFLVYPNIVKFMFSNFSCVSIDKLDSYLKENTAIRCWDSTHKKYSLTVAVPGIIVWAIGFPLILLLLMTKHRKRLHLDKYRVIFGFLFNGYKPSKYFWEFIIMYRKIILITIAVFMASQAIILQALTVVIALIASLYMQYSSKPYSSNQLNHMETEALFTATITIYCGLYYISNSINDVIKMVLFIVIVLGNSYFLIYWVYYMLQALIDMLLKVFPQFRHFFRRGDAFEENFNEENIVRDGVFFNKFEGKKSYTFLSIPKTENKVEMKFMSMEDAYREVIIKDINELADEN